MRCACPVCGKGKLYDGLLSVRDRCDICGADLSAHEKGDGPAIFVILLVGFIVTTLAGIVEVTWEPPYWVHIALWLPLIVGLSLWLLRVMKAWIIAMQYRHMGL